MSTEGYSFREGIKSKIITRNDNNSLIRKQISVRCNWEQLYCMECSVYSEISCPPWSCLINWTIAILLASSLCVYCNQSPWWSRQTNLPASPVPNQLQLASSLTLHLLAFAAPNVDPYAHIGGISNILHSTSQYQLSTILQPKLKIVTYVGRELHKLLKTRG